MVGRKRGENKTQPVIDSDYINYILDIFDVAPYKDDETGTTIIIPYINPNYLLTHNQVIHNNEEGEPIKQFWYNNIEEYIRISIQRWYAPRLNNIYYPYGKFLRVSINSEGLTKDSIEPAYQIIQSLYNRAVINGKVQESDILDDADVKCEKIALKNALKYSAVGNICFVKVNKKLLKMEYPDNKPSPYEYFNCINAHGEKTNL